MALYKSVFNTLIYAHTRATLLWPQPAGPSARTGLRPVKKPLLFSRSSLINTENKIPLWGVQKQRQSVVPVFTYVNNAQLRTKQCMERTCNEFANIYNIHVSGPNSECASSLFGHSCIAMHYDSDQQSAIYQSRSNHTIAYYET